MVIVNGYKVMHSVSTDKITNIAGIILAGGKSSRMGRDKAKIEFKGKILLDHMYSLLKDSGIQKIYISRGEEIKDIIPNCGPLGGIYSVLQKIEDQEVIILPVDMPLLSMELLQKLIDTEYDDAAIFKNYNFPLKLRNSNIINTKLRNKLNGVNSTKSLSVSSLLNEINIKEIFLFSAEEQFFINVNTVEELEKIR